MESVNGLKKVFSPMMIRHLEIKNRMVFQPHVPYFAGLDGYPTDETKSYYIERAKGGIGLIVMESMMIHPTGVYAPGCICLFNEGIVDSFGSFTDDIHRYGAKIIGQLSHCGDNTVAKPFQLAYAPSAIPDFGSRVVPKELEKSMIREIIEGFGDGAAILEKAGFDGTELKFAHDGLLRAFCLPALNKRTDEYGGSYENRLRFIKEIIENIRQKTSDSFVIGVRLCLDQFVDEGVTQEYGIQLAESCEEFGVDYINGDSGSASDGSLQIFPMCMPLGAGVYLASEVKKHVHIPVVGFGRLNDPVLMEMALEEGHCDLVGSARQFICDPEMPNKAREGRLDDIRHCIACNEACIYQCMQAKPIHCVQNPACGREKEMGIGTLSETDAPLNVVVVGAGIAGMKAAEILAKRGHKVSVYEKSDRVGGQINLAEKMPYRAEISEVSRYIKLQLDKYNVPIYLNTEVDSGLISELNPDRVIIATGSNEHSDYRLKCSNAAFRIMDVREALLNPEEIGKRVVVFDREGNMKGGEIAEYILGLDSSVCYVSPYDSMGPDMDPLTLTMLRKRLFSYEKFQYKTLYDLERGEHKDVTLKHVYSHAEETVEDIDTLILVDFPVSDNRLYKEICSERSGVFSVGDCNAPRLIEQNIFEAEVLGRSM